MVRTVSAQIGVDSGRVMTVRGPILVSDMGVTLMHEHILVDASGKWVPPSATEDLYLIDRQVSIEILGDLRMNPLACRDNCRITDQNIAVEELMRFKNLGGQTVVDPTNIGIGRNPEALKHISDLTGLNIIMGAGYYLDPTLPPYVAKESIEQLCRRIEYDLGAAAEKPLVAAGLIGEIGISGKMTANEEKSLRAAALANAKTGVPLAIHLPGWQRVGHQILDIVATEGADLHHTILCHMNPSHDDTAYQQELVARGVFIEYDMIGMNYFYADEQAQSPSDEDNARAIKGLIDAGCVEQILLSQDVFLKMMLTSYGGHGYGYILHHFVPRLKRHGVSDDQIETLLVENPQRVFSRLP